MFCFLASHVHVSCLVEAIIHDDLTLYIGMTPDMFKCFGKNYIQNIKRSILKENTPIKYFIIFHPTLIKEPTSILSPHLHPNLSHGNFLLPNHRIGHDTIRF